MTIPSNYGLSLGYNTTPVALHALSAPLFWRYQWGPDDAFIQPGRVGGDLMAIEGVARVRWTLAVVTQAEYDYLRTNVYTARSAQLTLRTRDWRASGKPFAHFNVIGYWTPLTDGIGRPDLGHWNDLILDFIIVGTAP